MPYVDPDKRREYQRERARRLRADPEYREREFARIVASNRRRRQEAMKDPDLAEALRKEARERMREWREKNPDKAKAAHRRSNAKKNHAKEWRWANLEKARPRERARRAVYVAIRRGVLIPQPCEVCGVEPYRNGRRYVQAHHPDYSKPLDVRWLCPRHHGALLRI